MADIQEYSLQDITSINLNSSQYGKDINDRFEAIDENFKNIISSEFLKGEDGQNLGLVECILKEDSIISNLFTINDEEVSYDWLIKNIEESIKTRLNVSNGKLNDISGHKWNEGIDGSRLYLLCKHVGEKSIIISSLPYTHVDSRFANIKYDTENLESYENLIDTSCTIIYKDNGFVSYTTTPTIYYDRNVGNGEFCWEINGSKSGLICRGPQGPSGVTNNTLILIIDKKIEEISGTKLHPILGVCWWDGKTYSILTTDKAIDKGIELTSNIMCACFYGEKDASGNIFIVGLKNSDGVVQTYSVMSASEVTEDVGGTVKLEGTLEDGTLTLSDKYQLVNGMISLSDEGGDEGGDEGSSGDITVTIPGNYVSGYIVSQTICFDGGECYVYAGDKVCHIPALLELSSLSELMYKIGTTPGTSKGLFVRFNPYDDSAVALYTKDENTAVLGAVENGRLDVYESVSGKTLEIDFPTVNCNDITLNRIKSISNTADYTTVNTGLTVKKGFTFQDKEIILDGYDVRLKESSVLNIPAIVCENRSTNNEIHEKVSEYIKDIFIGNIRDEEPLYGFVFLYLPKSEDLVSGHTINLWWNNRVPVVLLNSDSEVIYPNPSTATSPYWYCSAGDKAITKVEEDNIYTDINIKYIQPVHLYAPIGQHDWIGETYMTGKDDRSGQRAYYSFVILGEVPKYDRLPYMDSNKRNNYGLWSGACRIFYDEYINYMEKYVDYVEDWGDFIEINPIIRPTRYYKLTITYIKNENGDHIWYLYY